MWNRDARAISAWAVVKPDIERAATAGHLCFVRSNPVQPARVHSAKDVGDEKRQMRPPPYP